MPAQYERSLRRANRYLDVAQSFRARCPDICATLPFDHILFQLHKIGEFARQRKELGGPIGGAARLRELLYFYRLALQKLNASF